MKNTLLIALAFTSSFASAQKTEGELVYTEKIDMHSQIPDGPQAEMIKGMIPQFQESESTLIFSKTESLYQAKEAATENEAIEEEGNFKVEIKMERPDEKTYMDLANNLTVQQKDLMGRLFLIKDSIDQSAWKISGESKKINGLECMRATMVTDSTEIIAWFTPQIPVSTGPMGFGGLPGLIFYLKIDDFMEVSIKNMVFRDLVKNEIKAPNKGKVVTMDEYDELSAKKMEEMKAQHGGNGGAIIIESE